MTRRSINSVLVVAALLLLIASCGPMSRPTGYGGLEVGKSAPKIEAAGWVNGTPPGLKELKGKVIVIDAWATYCRPCREKAPVLVRTYNKFHSRGVVFIGLTAEDSSLLPQIQQFLKETGITWPNGYGAIPTLRGLDAQVVPLAWVIGRDGKVAWNAASKESLEEAIESALAKEPTSKSGE